MNKKFDFIRKRISEGKKVSDKLIEDAVIENLRETFAQDKEAEVKE